MGDGYSPEVTDTGDRADAIAAEEGHKPELHTSESDAEEPKYLTLT